MTDEEIQSRLELLVMWDFVFTGVACYRDAVERTHGIRFEIRPKEMGHNVPHCHAEFQGQSISISLVDFSVLAGNIPKHKQKIAVDWVKENKDVLRPHWNKYHELEV